MIATTYNIHAFDNYNRLYLTHFGRYGSEAPYTFSVLSREKCCLTMKTSSKEDRANKVFLSIGGYFYATYTMPNSDTLEIDITDIISSLDIGIYRTNVTIETNETQKSYEFDLSISYGLDFMRLAKYMGHFGEGTNKRCPLFGSVNPTTGQRNIEFIAMPEELIVPFTDNYTRRFTYLSYFTFYCWTQYGGTSTVYIYQNGAQINKYIGNYYSTIIQINNLQPFSQWYSKIIGRNTPFGGVPRPMKNGILLRGTLPYQLRQGSSTPVSTYKFAFFLEILEIGENVDVENLMPNASAMPYTLRQEMRMKVGIRNISRFDYIIYSMFYICEDLQVAFDDYIDTNALSLIDVTERGYNARLKSKDFVVPNTERTDFILDLIISY